MCGFITSYVVVIDKAVQIFIVTFSYVNVCMDFMREAHVYLIIFDPQSLMAELIRDPWQNRLVETGKRELCPLLRRLSSIAPMNMPTTLPTATMQQNNHDYLYKYIFRSYNFIGFYFDLGSQKIIGPHLSKVTGLSPDGLPTPETLASSALVALKRVGESWGVRSYGGEVVRWIGEAKVRFLET